MPRMIGVLNSNYPEHDKHTDNDCYAVSQLFWRNLAQTVCTFTTKATNAVADLAAAVAATVAAAVPKSLP